MQSNRAWWLSTFYSLCVQSLVRLCLIAIVEGYATAERTPDVIGAQRSLHLALRLFIASSGGHDPLVLTWTRETMSSSRPEEAGRAVHYKLAQSAVQQSTWHDRKIRNSRDYLNKIFKDDGIFDALDCRNGTAQARPLMTPRESFNESKYDPILICIPYTNIRSLVHMQRSSSFNARLATGPSRTNKLKSINITFTHITLGLALHFSTTTTAPHFIVRQLGRLKQMNVAIAAQNSRERI